MHQSALLEFFPVLLGVPKGRPGVAPRRVAPIPEPRTRSPRSISGAAAASQRRPTSIIVALGAAHCPWTP